MGMTSFSSSFVENCAGADGGGAALAAGAGEAAEVAAGTAADFGAVAGAVAAVVVVFEDALDCIVA
jgi:hypothetical protein